MNRIRSFTLLETLVVIGVLAVVATVVIMVINPGDLLKETRDSTRLSDLRTVHSALTLYEIDQTGFLGTSSIVYVSIPDTTTTCANLGLPSLPSGWSYNCVTSANLRKIDGNGWIPVNFLSITYNSPIAKLPTDPINTTATGNYYTYVTGGSWELNTRLESNKYRYGGSQNKTANDGGNNDYLYEIGNNLNLILDNENQIKDGNMELSGTSYWSNYNLVVSKTKDDLTKASGRQSLRIVTNGYTGGVLYSYSLPLPASGKVYLQLSVKVAPGKTFGWQCYCRPGGFCCWQFRFSGKTNTEWQRFSQIDDISIATSGIYSAYFSQSSGPADSEFWLDDVIIRPVY